MTLQQNVSTAIGLRKVRAFLRDTDSLPEIPAGTAIGTAWEGHVLDGALALSPTIPEPNRVAARGDDRIYHTFSLPPTEGVTGELRLSKLHMAFAAAMAGTKVFGSPPTRKIGLSTEKVGLEKTLIMYGSRQGIDSETGSAYFGQQCWVTYLFLNSTAVLRPPTMEDQAIGESTYAVTANDSTVDELGAAFTEDLNGFTQTPFMVVVSQDQFHLDAFLGDNSETEFTLSHTPTATSQTIVSVDGVVADSGWSETGGVVTFGSAPADGAKIVVEYEYE